MDKRELFWGIFFGFLLLAAVLFFSFQKSNSGFFRVTFCDVGQGDAALLQTPGRQDILIDGGPSEEVLTCLRNHLPFWDRQLEMVIVSHPQADHIGGLIPVFKRYKIGLLMMGMEGEKSPEYAQLKKTIEEKKIPIKNPFLGQVIDYGDGVKAEIIWPEREWLSDWSRGDSSVLGVSTFSGDLNQVSTMIRFSYGDFDVLFTGDGDEEVQDDILRKTDIQPVEVLKVPHHGSKKALLDEFLEKVSPELAVISVGWENPFGHPAKELIKRIEDLQITLLRTDIDREIKIVTDGDDWERK